MKLTIGMSVVVGRWTEVKYAFVASFREKKVPWLLTVLNTLFIFDFGLDYYFG